MQTPLRITFRHVKHSTAIEFAIRQHALRLEKFHNRIIGCHVVLDGASAQGKHASKQGSGHGDFGVHIELTVPGAAINVSNTPDTNFELADPYHAVREAFEKARRQLVDFEAARTS